MHFKFHIWYLMLSTLISSCSDEKEPVVVPPETEIFNIQYSIDMDSHYRIFKVICDHYEPSLGFNLEFSYYGDSIIKKSETVLPGNRSRSLTAYLINSDGRADSSLTRYYYNDDLTSRTRTIYKYDTEGYLISRTENSTSLYNSYTTSYTTTYENMNGNRIRVIFDPLKPGSFINGKYISYTYGSEQNIIDLESFTGSWLGKINKNLRNSYIVGGSLSDSPPCLNYRYIMRTDGLVEKITEVPCRTSNYRIVSTFTYKIVQ